MPQRNATPAFFKQLAKTVLAMKLRHLFLNNITTRYKYLAMFLEACSETLCQVELYSVSLARPNDGHAALCFLGNFKTLDT
jgi:hypothetical protein